MSQTIQLGKRSVTIYSFTGKVASASKNMETRVHGGGGGGYSYKGTGSSAPVTISSTTIIHDQLFLVDVAGNERALQLQGFNLACRESNTVTAMWAIAGGESTGPYFAIINHSTNSQFVNDKIINGIVLRCTRPGWGLIIIMAFLMFLFFPIPMLYGLYYYFGVFIKNVKLFKSSIQFPVVEKRSGNMVGI